MFCSYEFSNQKLSKHISSKNMVQLQLQTSVEKVYLEEFRNCMIFSYSVDRTLSAPDFFFRPKIFVD